MLRERARTNPLDDPQYHALLRALAQGFTPPFPAEVANRLVCLRLLVESAAMHEGRPGWPTPQQAQRARSLGVAR